MAGSSRRDKEGAGSLRQQVYAYLEEEILSGRSRPGDSLTEIGIAKALGVSRTPVREAIRQLDQEGLVDFVPNRGAVVKGLSEQDILDIGELRTKIEGIAARRAAQAVSDSQLAELAGLIEQEKASTARREPESLTRLDSLFHEIIFEASGSRLLNRTLRTFHHAIRQARRLSLLGESRAEKTLAEHMAILEALQRRDPRQAEFLMSQHVKNATRNMQRLQQKAQPPTDM